MIPVIRGLVAPASIVHEFCPGADPVASSTVMPITFDFGSEMPTFHIHAEKFHGPRLLAAWPPGELDFRRKAAPSMWLISSQRHFSIPQRPRFDSAERAVNACGKITGPC